MRPFVRVWIVAVVACPAFLGATAQAIDIPYQFDPNRHNRFLSGFDSSPVQNPNVLGIPGLDFSGVGWGSDADPSSDPHALNDFRRLNVALVTPRHFIVANHYKPNVGTAVNFLGRDGVVRSYTVESYVNLNFNPNDQTSNQPDLIVGQLSIAVQTSQMAIYPVVRPGPFEFPLANTPPEYVDFYRGREIVVVGQNDLSSPTEFDPRGGKIGKNVIDDVFEYNFGSSATNTHGYGYFTPPNTPDAAKLVEGDSGSPSFLLWDGMLTALGAHSGVGTLNNMPYNVDSFLPYYVDQINQKILSTGFQITLLSPVPEPGAMALVGAAGAAAVGWRRWRRRVIA